VFLVNSRYPHFSATPQRSEREAPHPGGHTFSRSYGVNLPSSLARVLSRALGYSPRPPESVSGTVTRAAQHAAFLGSLGSLSYGAEAPPHYLSAMTAPRLSLTGPTRPTYWFEPATTARRLSIPFSVPACFKAIPNGAGILACLPSPTPFGLGLGTD
jgi:hypothetical protein